MEKENISWVNNDFDHKKLYDAVRKRPVMYFGSTSLGGLHLAISNLVHYCIDSHKREISLTLNGANVVIRHEGEKLVSNFCTDITKAACDTFIYENNQFQFRFDKEIFESVEPNMDALFDTLRELAFLNKNLHITFNEHTFHYENGLIDLYQYLQVKSGLYWRSKHVPASFHAEDDCMEVDVVFAPTSSSFDSCIFSYVNNHRTEDNGVHVDGFIKGLKSVLNKYKQYSCEHMATLKNIDVGLIIHVKTLNPQYYGSTKRKLSNTEIYQFVMKATKENLIRIFTGNPRIAHKFVKCWRC